MVYYADQCKEQNISNKDIQHIMISPIISVIVGLGMYFACLKTGFYAQHPVWSIIFCILAFLAVQIVISLVIRKLSNRITAVLQGIMQETQRRIMVKQNQFMRRPLSQDQMIRELEKEQAAGIGQMLKALDLYNPLYLWQPLLKKQVNTMRMMFHYQMKDFDKVDELLKNCILMDAQSISMKMARMYVNKEDDKALDKFYKKKCFRFKGDESALTASVYAWILVKQERIDEAVKALADAKVPSRDNPVVVKNWEMLVNGKIKHFSNAQIGDMWYALHLEKPKMQKVQQQVRYR